VTLVSNIWPINAFILRIINDRSDTIDSEYKIISFADVHSDQFMRRDFFATKLIGEDEKFS